MPTINLINTPFVNGDSPTGTEVSEVFYLPAAVPVSLEGINGWLDKGNTDATFTQVTYDQVQENTFQTTGHSVGTANLDYFDYWFQSIGLSTNYGGVWADPRDYLADFKPIPGGSITFYLAETSLVVFTWTVLWGNDSRVGNRSFIDPVAIDSRTQPGSDTVLALFRDDLFVEGQLRQASRSIYALIKDELAVTWSPTDTTSNTDWNLNDECHVGMVKNRYWHGHHTETLAPGWHSASLRLLGSGFDGITDQLKPQEAPVNATDGAFTYRAQRQARVWSRSLRYVAFSQGGGE